VIAAGVLSLYLLAGGSGALLNSIFPADLEKAIKAVLVSDQARAQEAAKIVEQSRKALEASMKRGSQAAKEFAKVDDDKESGLAELQPGLDAIAAERRRAEKEALDAVFALRKSVTGEEWKQAFDRTKK
jgi:hypothetical protein